MDIILLIDKKIEIAIVENDKITKKESSDDQGIIGNYQFINNKLYTTWVNGEEQVFYKLANKFYSLNYININMNVFNIIHNYNNLMFVSYNNKLYNLDDDSQCFEYEIVDEILIIKWDKIFKYYNKNINNVYEVIIIPFWFDCNYYISKTSYFDIYNNDEWNLTIRDYVLNGIKNNIPCYDKTEMILDNKICKVIINHSHFHLLNLQDNNYYKITIEDDIITIISPPFIYKNNEIIFNSKITKYINKSFIKNKYNLYEEVETNINIKTNNVYIIGNINNGGSTKYINDLKKHYTNKVFKNLNSNLEIINTEFYPDDIILIQNLFFTDIEINNLLNLNNIIICIHDFYWLNDKILRNFDDNTFPWHSNYVNKIIIDEQIIKLFKKAKYIIHPSVFTYNIYEKYFLDNNFVLIPHNDIKIIYKNLFIPPIIDNIINIGVFHKYVCYKGKKIIEYLKEKFNNYKNYSICYYIVGINAEEYDETTDFNSYIRKYNIHCLPLLNEYAETYCYYLSKAINTGLPIIYNNIGSFKQRLNIKKKSYFKIEYDEGKGMDYSLLDKEFQRMLDFIILENGKHDKVIHDDKLYYNKAYDNMFL